MQEVYQDATSVLNISIISCIKQYSDTMLSVIDRLFRATRGVFVVAFLGEDIHH